MMTRKEKALNTRAKLYDSALALMSDKSIEEITIQHICKKAGVSVGSFYKHFKTKTDIFIEMYDQADHFFSDKYQSTDVTISAKHAIVDYFKTYAQYNQNIGLVTVKQLYTTNNKLFITKDRDMQKMLERIINSGQEKESITQDLSAEEITEFLFISARGLIYNWCLHDGSFDLIDGLTAYVTRLLKAFDFKS